MLGPDHILDVPESNYKFKIRRTSFLFFELSLLGYYLFIAISIGNIIWDFPPFQHDSFMATCLWFLLGLIVNVALFLCYVGLAAIPFSCPVLLFYNWYKTSLKYDDSLNESGLHVFYKEYLNGIRSPIFVGFVVATMLILVMSGLFLFNNSQETPLIYTSIAGASFVYALISAWYGFIIRQTVLGVLG